MYDLIILAITCLVCWMVCGNLFAMILYDVRKSDIAHGGNDVERYFYGGGKLFLCLPLARHHPERGGWQLVGSHPAKFLLWDQAWYGRFEMGKVPIQDREPVVIIPFQDERKI